MVTVLNCTIVRVQVPEVPGSRMCVLFHWIEGRKYKQLSPRTAGDVGSTLGKLHWLSTKFKPSRVLPNAPIQLDLILVE
jgi:Ser/Thr protein kinase RdoA (MazF antagonist)